MVSKELYKDVYKYSIITMYLLYVIALFGISTVAPEYLHYLTTFIKYYVLLVLIIRFNPWNKFKVDDFDREIVFSFSLFYLITSLITTSIQNFIFTNIEKVKNNIMIK